MSYLKCTGDTFQGQPEEEAEEGLLLGGVEARGGVPRGGRRQRTPQKGGLVQWRLVVCKHLLMTYTKTHCFYLQIMRK